MNDAVTAVADLFRLVPLIVRQVIYGALGVVVLADAWVLDLPDTASDGILSTFAGLTMIMALANATQKADPPSPPSGGVDPAFPDEFA